MDSNSLPTWIDEEFEFPLTTENVIDQAGDHEVDAPDSVNSETLAAILETGGDETYQSREDLLAAIRGNLSDEYIGRKYYDDRGCNPMTRERGVPRDTVDHSF